MRLKGGKVLLDLTGYGDINNSDINHPLSEEETKAILEKGLIVLIIADTHKIAFEPLIVEVEDGVGVTYNNIDCSGAHTCKITFDDNGNTFDLVME